MQNTLPVAPQSFARYEFKYLLGTALCEQIESEVSHFMRYDGFVHPEFGNRYPVKSLYFDNAVASNYYEKIDGVKTRRKFRIRTYTDDPKEESPVFLEVKGRHIERTYKSRVRIGRDQVELFTKNLDCSFLLSTFPGVDLIESFIYDSIRKTVRPAVLVDYMRRPYTSDYDRNFRATFDSHLTAVACGELFPSSGVRRMECLPGYTVLEIKFDRRIPAWFHRVLQSYNLRRLSISKFCTGMEYCGLAEDLS